MKHLLEMAGFQIDTGFFRSNDDYKTKNGGLDRVKRIVSTLGSLFNHNDTCTFDGFELEETF